MTALPWAIYLRVSTDQQADSGISLEAQEEACRCYAKLRGWTVAEVLSDPGFSGASTTRPGLQRLMERLRRGEVGGVVAWRLDRLTRDLRFLLELVHLCDAHQAGIVSVTESLDTSTPSGRLMLSILGAFAQHERDSIRERVTSAMAHGRAQGLWMGGQVPVGLCVVVGEDGKRRLAAGEAAPIVRQAWRWILDGATLAEVAERFTRAGLSRQGSGRRSPWTGAAVYTALLSPHAVPLLVSAADQMAVKTELSQRDCPGRRKGRSGPSQALQPSPLAGVFRCPTCGGAMVQVSARGHGGTYRYFRCAAKVRRLCAQKDLRCEPIEACILEQVAAACAQDGPYRAAIEATMATARDRLAVARREKASLQAERDQLSARIGDMVLQQRIGRSAAWNEGMRLLGEQLARVDKGLAEATAAVSVGELDDRDTSLILDAIGDQTAGLPTADPTTQARTIRALVKTATIKNADILLELYQPDQANPGSYNSSKWFAGWDGVRTPAGGATVAVRVAGKGVLSRRVRSRRGERGLFVAGEPVLIG